MGKLFKNQSGFSIIEGLIAIIVVVGLLSAGWLVYRHDHKVKKVTTTPSQTASADHFLIVKELGIKIKLSTTLSTIYYKVKPNTTINGKPVVALYLHLLDKYPQCNSASNNDGVAGIETFTSGETDPVVGDFANSYPNAPVINGLHYYITNEQYDCSAGAYKDMTMIRNAFLSAYPTIQSVK